MRRPAAVLTFTFILCTFACKQVCADELTPQKQADIRKLMEITGSAKIGIQMSDSLMQVITQALKQQHPEVPDRVLTIVRNEVSALLRENYDAPGGFLDQVIPIYARYLTHSEIKEILAFYQTDTGRKIIEILPRVSAESIAVGRKWGQSMGPEIQRRVQEALEREGIEPGVGPR